MKCTEPGSPLCADHASEVVTWYVDEIPILGFLKIERRRGASLISTTETLDWGHAK